MERSRAIETLIAALALLTIAATLTLTIENVSPETGKATPIAEPAPALEPPTPVAVRTGCAGDPATRPAECAVQEAAILASTVRLEFDAECADPAGGQNADRRASHGTVINSRYILTHDHFSLSLRETPPDCTRHLNVFNAAGEKVLADVRFLAFEAHNAGPEMTLLDFGDYGLLARVGLSSARCDLAGAEALQPGAMVALTDWNGQNAFVQWVTVTAIRHQDGVRTVELNHFALPGASGGGVFLDGLHIGNTWFRFTIKSETEQTMYQATVAALNTSAGCEIATVE